MNNFVEKSRSGLVRAHGSEQGQSERRAKTGAPEPAGVNTRAKAQHTVPLVARSAEKHSIVLDRRHHATRARALAPGEPWRGIMTAE